METSTQTNAILNAIDLELKELLEKDLELYRSANEIKQPEIKKAA